MPKDNITETFLSYRDKGDPRDLGKVFDKTSTHLHQLACHLTLDQNDADDLLQATFLIAIERRHKYQPSGSVLSWLFGIMAKEAHAKRRAAGRKLWKGAPPQTLDEQTPHQVLEGKELSKAVMGAIAKMPEQYQPVLTLSLRYGLGSSEIATNLIRPPATVRKQLSRGLEILRQSLPASFIAGSVVLTTPAAGLAATREVVLSKASLAAQSATTSAALTKLALWTAAGTLTAGTLTAAALAVSFWGLDVRTATIDVFQEATAPVVAQMESVGPAAVTSVLQADPFSPSLRSLMTFSSPVSNTQWRVTTMNPISSHSSLSQNLGIPSLMLGAVGLLSAVVPGQSVIYSHAGENPADDLGVAVSDAGDVNFDGYADIVTSSRNYDADPDGTPGTGDEVSNVGRVYVYSGKDGTALYIFDGENKSDALGQSVSNAGDVNFDGYADFVASALDYDLDPDGTLGTGDEVSSVGRVYVYSGKDGTTLYTFEGQIRFDRLGQSVSDGGDVDLDGCPDIVASTEGYDLDPDGTLGTGDEVTTIGRVYVYSGKDGTTLHAFDGENMSDGLGRSVSDGGDVNFDGYADIVASAAGYDLDPDGTPGSGDEAGNVGRVYVYSGKDGTTLYTFTGENQADGLGRSVSDVGDVNFDGYADIAAGAPFVDLDPDGTPGSGDEANNIGRVHVYSGKDGTTLYTFDGEDANILLGTSLDAAGDVNLDGYPDIVTSAGGWSFDYDGPDNTAGPSGPGPDGTVGTQDDDVDDIRSNGRVYVYSGKDGTTLRTIDGEFGGMRLFTCCAFWTGDGDFLGNSVSGAGDVNGDGVPDILAGSVGWKPVPLGPDGTAHSGDESVRYGRSIAFSGDPLSLTADKHLLSIGVANSQTMTIDGGVANALKNYWLFTGFAASGDTPGVTVAPGVVIPLNQPDPLTSFVISLTQGGGGAPTFVGWKGLLDGAGKASPSLNTSGPVPVAVGVTLHHAALVYTADGCGLGCDTFQLATNWVPMTTMP